MFLSSYRSSYEACRGYFTIDVICVCSEVLGFMFYCV